MISEIGLYTGNGSDGFSPAVLSFKPDLVLIHSIGAALSYDFVFKTADHPSNESSYMRADTANLSTGIKTLVTGGFTLGTSDYVNKNGIQYAFLAIKATSAKDFCTFTYTGDASDGKAITGFGFSPDWVAIKSNSAITGAHKCRGSTDTQTYFGGNDRTDLIASLGADGITVNNGSADAGNLVNVNATAHYGFAFKTIPGALSVFQYVGNGSDNTDINFGGSGANGNFAPGFIWIKASDSANPVIARIGVQTGDSSIQIDGNTLANAIQSVGLGTFQVGSDSGVNNSGRTYNVLVMRGSISSPTLQRLNGLRPRQFAPGLAR